MTILLAGDMGGTKTTLGLYASSNPRDPLRARTYPNIGYSGPERLIEDFLSEGREKVERICLGVAGPVTGNRAKWTNLPWTIDAERLAHRFAVPHVRLLNDLAAIGESLPLLEAGDLLTLQSGTPAPAGTRAIIAPGTGLGEAFAVWDGAGFRVQASEGGHSDFAPRNDTEIALLAYYRERIGHVSYETVCSGVGIQNIYRFLTQSGMAAESQKLPAEFFQASDWTPMIVQYALTEGNAVEACRETLNIFVSVLGAEAGNLALKVLATGGVFLGGGIPRRIIPLLQQEDFLSAFLDKGRFRELLARVPVHVILRSDAALMGAAFYGTKALA